MNSFYTIIIVCIFYSCKFMKCDLTLFSILGDDILSTYIYLISLTSVFPIMAALCEIFEPTN